MGTLTITTAWHAAVLDMGRRVGVAVQAQPECPCSSCTTMVWQDRAQLDGGLLALELTPVALLPATGTQPVRYVVGEVAAQWDALGNLEPM
jgi:hypothetical protein